MAGGQAGLERTFDNFDKEKEEEKEKEPNVGSARALKESCTENSKILNKKSYVFTISII